MNTIYKNVAFDQSMPAEFTRKAKDQAVKPLGTFAGVIYKTLYQLNGEVVPSDTSEQLIADGLNS
jgi:hypothetical protein